jgi:hypothetical protein
MKKLLLILLSLPMIGFGQFQEKLDSSHFIMNSPAVTFNLTTVYNYDTQGRCLSGITMYDSSSVFYDSIGNFCFSLDGILVEYKYNTATDLMSQQFTKLLDIANQDTVTWVTVNFTYDANNLLTEITKIQDWNCIFNGSDNSKYAHSYNLFNECISIESSKWDGISYLPSNKTDYIWQAGLLMSSIDLQYILGAWDTTSISHNSYDNGCLVLTSTYSFNNFQTDTTVYTYNSTPMAFTAAPMQVYENIFTQPKQISSSQVISSGTTIQEFYYYYSSFSGTSLIEEHSTNKELLKVTDLLGREKKGTKNEVLFYIYDDGTVEKKIVIE